MYILRFLFLLEFCLNLTLHFIGFGIVATKKFTQGEFLLEYASECLKKKEGIERERRYEAASSSAKIGSFLFFSGNLW